MSTDFSIKPVGAPVATPIVQPVSEAAQRRSRPNCRRAKASRRQMRAHARRIDSDAVASRFPDRRIRWLSIAPHASIVYQVVDNRTSLVVQQFPDEAVLRRRAYFHTLDLTKGAPCAPSPPTARLDARTVKPCLTGPRRGCN